MTTLPAAERARLSVPKEGSSDGDISFLTTEQHQQLEKMKHRNVTKKPFFEKGNSLIFLAVVLRTKLQTSGSQTFFL